MPAAGGAGENQELRVHLVDAGNAGAPVVVFLHGNPSRSYMWRHQIAAAVAAGYRIIPPDLIGMGLSDKPSEMSDYTVARHVESMRALLVERVGATYFDRCTDTCGSSATKPRTWSSTSDCAVDHDVTSTNIERNPAVRADHDSPPPR